jgi:predicted Zn-dependent protease
MTDRTELLALAHQALAASTADQTEVRVAAGEDGLTRFANNAVHQNVYESGVSVSLRAVMGKRIGVASSNDPSADGIRRLAEKACELARLAAPNEEFVSLPSPTEQTPGCEVCPAQTTVAFGPENRAGAVQVMLSIAEESGLVAAGQFATGHAATAVANSLGIEAFWHTSSARGRVVMQGSDSSGFSEAVADEVYSICPETLARRAAGKALKSAGPREVEPGKYTVILEPLASTDMIGMLAVYDMHALAHQEGRSFTTGKIGEKVCGDNISIWDDGCDPRGLRHPFDHEGVPRQRVNIIENGVLRGVPYDSFTAGREPGAANTGHALPAPSTWGPVPMNLFINAGDSSVEDMIAATERGILVTRFHYTNMIHPVRTVLTGMTRDGTFLVEDGEVVGGVKNLRFTQSILEALSNVDMIGNAGELQDWVWAPALRIQGFSFSSGTEF